MSDVVFPATVRGLAYTVLKKPEFGTLVHRAANKTETRILQVQNPIWYFELIYEFLIDNPNRLTASLTYTDLKTMMGFFLQQQGQFSDFLFEDPDDHSVGPALVDGSPNTQAILQVVDDGVGHYYSPLQRNMGGEFYEDVTDLNGAIAVYANASSQSSPTNYSVLGPGLALPNVSFLGLYLAWTYPASWIANHNYAINNTILDPAGHIQKVTTDGGSSGGTEPTWNDSGGTTSDSGLVWTDQGYNPGPTTPVTATFDFYFRVRFQTDEQGFDKWANQWWTAGGSFASGSTPLRLVTVRVPKL